MSPDAPPASIVIPTRARLPYLEVALCSIAPQAAAAGAEVLVVDDAGASAAARELVERHGARYRAARGAARPERGAQYGRAGEHG